MGRGQCGLLLELCCHFKREKLKCTSRLACSLAEQMCGEIQVTLNMDRPQRHNCYHLEEREAGKVSSRYTTQAEGEQCALHQPNTGTESRSTLGDSWEEEE